MSRRRAIRRIFGSPILLRVAFLFYSLSLVLSPHLGVELAHAGALHPQSCNGQIFGDLRVERMPRLWAQLRVGAHLREDVLIENGLTLSGLSEVRLGLLDSGYQQDSRASMAYCSGAVEETHGSAVLDLASSPRESSVGFSEGVRVVAQCYEQGLGAGGGLDLVIKDADVMNISMSHLETPRDLLYEELFDYAYLHNTHMVFAAGNDFGKPIDVEDRYKNVFVVSSLTPYGDLSLFSNTGPSIDISAPSDTHIWTPHDPEFGGTSGAAPVVTGAIINLLKIYPELPPAHIQRILQATAIDVHTPGWDKETGSGMVNIPASMQVVIGLKTGAFQLPAEPAQDRESVRHYLSTLRLTPRENWNQISLEGDGTHDQVCGQYESDVKRIWTNYFYSLGENTADAQAVADIMNTHGALDLALAYVPTQENVLKRIHDLLDENIRMYFIAANRKPASLSNLLLILTRPDIQLTATERDDLVVKFKQILRRSSTQQYLKATLIKVLSSLGGGVEDLDFLMKLRQEDITGGTNNRVFVNSRGEATDGFAYYKKSILDNLGPQWVDGAMTLFKQSMGNVDPSVLQYFYTVDESAVGSVLSHAEGQDDYRVFQAVLPFLGTQALGNINRGILYGFLTTFAESEETPKRLMAFEGFSKVAHLFEPTDDLRRLLISAALDKNSEVAVKGMAALADLYRGRDSLMVDVSSVLLSKLTDADKNVRRGAGDGLVMLHANGRSDDLLDSAETWVDRRLNGHIFGIMGSVDGPPYFIDLHDLFQLRRNYRVSKDEVLADMTRVYARMVSQAHAPEHAAERLLRLLTDRSQDLKNVLTGSSTSLSSLGLAVGDIFKVLRNNAQHVATWDGVGDLMDLITTARSADDRFNLVYTVVKIAQQDPRLLRDETIFNFVSSARLSESRLTERLLERLGETGF